MTNPETKIKLTPEGQKLFEELERKAAEKAAKQPKPEPQPTKKGGEA